MMTAAKLIKELERLCYEYGPDIEVRKCQPDSSHTIAIKSVALDDTDEDPANWTIEL